jgi:RNA polymerase sigma factor (TIGR02999 family)
MHGVHDEPQQLIEAMRAGDRGAASRLLWLVHDELKQTAAAKLEKAGGDPSLDPTGLVRGAYLKLAANARKDWLDRARFMAIGADAARRVVREMGNRFGGKGRAPLVISVPTPLGPQRAKTVDAARVEKAIARLAPLDARQASLAEQRLFGGLSPRESSGVLDTDEAAVESQWDFVRAWLDRELAREEA